MTVALTVLVIVLVAVLAAWTAALVAQRAATQRLVAASRVLDADPRPPVTPGPGGLDAALDHLEHSVAQAVERRSRVASAEDRLSWALGAIGHGVVIFDERGLVVYRNDPAASFLAARHSDALVEEAISILAADALRGRRVERELELFGPPRRILNVRAVPLADPARPSGVLVVVEDTSERRRLENVRRDFVANISHELKTPNRGAGVAGRDAARRARPGRDPPAGRAPGQRGIPGGAHHRRPARAVAPRGGVGSGQRARAGGDVPDRGLRPGGARCGAAGHRVRRRGGPGPAHGGRRTAPAGVGGDQPARQRREVQRARQHRRGASPHRRHLGRRHRT